MVFENRGKETDDFEDAVVSVFAFGGDVLTEDEVDELTASEDELITVNGSGGVPLR